MRALEEKDKEIERKRASIVEMLKKVEAYSTSTAKNKEDN